MVGAMALGGVKYTVYFSMRISRPVKAFGNAGTVSTLIVTWRSGRARNLVSS